MRKKNKIRPFLHILLLIKDSLQQQIHFNGNLFETNVVVVTRVHYIQSTLVISNSLISNNRLSRSQNMVPVLTQRSTNRQQNIVEKRRSNFSSFPQYFQYVSNLGVKLKIHSVKGGCPINCFPQFHKSDMSKYGHLEVFHRVLWISR